MYFFIKFTLLTATNEACTYSAVDTGEEFAVELTQGVGRPSYLLFRHLAHLAYITPGHNYITKSYFII